MMVLLLVSLYKPQRSTLKTRHNFKLNAVMRSRTFGCPSVGILQQGYFGQGGDISHLLCVRESSMEISANRMAPSLSRMIKIET